VRITSGPFVDFVATIDNITPDRRVWVLMEIMGGQTRVAVKVDQLQTV
jgi:transcriptional antiterminator RfaH